MLMDVLYRRLQGDKHARLKRIVDLKNNSLQDKADMFRAETTTALIGGPRPVENGKETKWVFLERTLKICGFSCAVDPCLQ